MLPNSGPPGSPATPAMCPADSEPRSSFYRRGRAFLLRVASSKSAFDNFKLSVDEITFVSPLEKGLFLIKVTFPPCFVFSLVAAQGCASPHDTTLVKHSLPSTLGSLPGVRGMDRQGWALFGPGGGCKQGTELCIEQIPAALQVPHTWGL